MTHATRTLRQPCLSVRTRALVQKFHQRALLTRGLFKMRLRARTIPISRSPVSTRSSPNEKITSLASKLNKESSDCSSFSSHSDLPGSVDSETRTQTETSSASSTDSVDTNCPSACKWEGCGVAVEHMHLVQHILQSHVFPQLISNRRKSFVCLWSGCRVFRQPSVSSAWLENHILDHTDAKGKPFRCIFDGCNLRFSTSILLERHLQRLHMITTCTQPSTLHSGATPSVISTRNTHTSSLETTVSNSFKSLPSTPTNVKRNLRRRRRPRSYRVRRTDFLDRRTQCVIENRLRLLRYLSDSNPDDLSEQLLASESGTSVPHRFPKPQGLNPPSKLRLRSARSTVTCDANKSTPVEDAMTMRKNRVLLLTIPYRFAGQRISEDSSTEFLVHWIHPCEPSPSWIRPNHFPSAGI